MFYVFAFCWKYSAVVTKEKQWKFKKEEVLLNDCKIASQIFNNFMKVFFSIK
jgi:hypothetical protein